MKTHYMSSSDIATETISKSKKTYSFMFCFLLIFENRWYIFGNYSATKAQRHKETIGLDLPPLSDGWQNRRKIKQLYNVSALVPWWHDP
jgi:hypothetical protein